VTEGQGQNGYSATSWLLVALFWAYVGIPFLWGLYETLKGVAALFTG
jgi:hypothetical protein